MYCEWGHFSHFKDKLDNKEIAFIDSTAMHRSDTNDIRTLHLNAKTLNFFLFNFAKK